jgi:hypothetical protein
MGKGKYYLITSFRCINTFLLLRLLIWRYDHLLSAIFSLIKKGKALPEASGDCVC